MSAAPRSNPLRYLADWLLPPLAWVLCRVLGLVTWHFSSRRKVALSNLHRAFPDKPRGWHERIGKRSVIRMFEMFLVPLIAPWPSERELNRRFSMSAEDRERMQGLADSGGGVIQTPHTTMTECIAMLPRVWNNGKPMMGFYRPLDFKPLDRYIHWARQRWGLELHSRKEGLIRGRDLLRQGGMVGILFDQNARGIGTLTLFMGSICSATDLPGILANKLGKGTILMYPRRKGFFRAEIQLIPIQHDGTTRGITAAASKTLEDLLTQDEEACADWFWVHQRWKALKWPHQRLGLDNKKSCIAEGLRLRGLDAVPRRLPYVFRLPANLQQARLFANELPQLRRSRPDAHCTVIAPEGAADAFVPGDNCEAIYAYRDKRDMQRILRDLRSEWLDTLFCLDLDGDLVAERRLCCAERGSGMARDEMPKHKGLYWFVPDDDALLASANYGRLLGAFLAASGMDAEAPAAPGADKA